MSVSVCFQNRLSFQEALLASGPRVLLGIARHFHHRSSHCMGLAVCLLVDEEHLINAMFLHFAIAPSIPVILTG